ncbi:Hypothetical predicted protein [Olea europaea subsp. europaea]|uniref:Uncharacterized protein n=1 Tax=Olea europaea subsp. europaea TaxID=158383 RepID=A0A8S0TLV8_OLEEU|nr:Hypothetical predicted protein [Olea europaea subsp. europaea]
MASGRRSGGSMGSPAPGECTRLGQLNRTIDGAGRVSSRLVSGATTCSGAMLERNHLCSAGHNGSRAAVRYSRRAARAARGANELHELAALKSEDARQQYTAGRLCSRFDRTV